MPAALVAAVSISSRVSDRAAPKSPLLHPAGLLEAAHQWSPRLADKVLSISRLGQAQPANPSTQPANPRDLRAVPP